MASTRGRIRDAANATADWILASGEHRVAKALVVVWVVAQSVLTPLLTWRRDREQAQRDGLHEDPKVIVGVDEAGRCQAFNRGPRALTHVELRRYMHVFDPKEGCEEAAGSVRKGEVPKHAAVLAPGEVISERSGPTPMPANELFECAGSSTACTTLLECQATFHRSADLKQFERTSFAGVTQNWKVEYPIVDIKATSHQRGGGETYTISVKSEWKPAFDCAQKKRAFRKSMEELMERFVTGADAVMQSK